MCIRLHLAGFGVPSESPDASLLLAWLSRNTDVPMGLVLLLPEALAATVSTHLTHLLQRLLKERRTVPTCNAPGRNSGSCILLYTPALSAKVP